MRVPVVETVVQLSRWGDTLRISATYFYRPKLVFGLPFGDTT